MGVPAGKSFHAGDCHGADCRDDPRHAQGTQSGQGQVIRAGLILALLLIVSATGAWADPVRIGFWNAELERRGPGLLLQDLGKSGVEDIDAALRLIEELNADVLVLSGVDYDATGAALGALNAGLTSPYPYLRALRPNSGIPSGADLNGDGQTDGPADALAFGFFPGQGGMAVLSRLSPRPDGDRDFSQFLWRDLPANRFPAAYRGLQDRLPLSSRGHYVTGLVLPGGRALDLLTWHGTTPAFDGPGDENGRRNADETAFWSLYLKGALPLPPPADLFVLLGQANTDPAKGDGDKTAIQTLLSDPALQDVLSGDTVDFGRDIGPLRVSYLLPSARLQVVGSGRLDVPDGVRHRPIWIAVSPR